MKLKDFIKEASKLSPDGEAHIVVDNGDIWFLESKPWYYDGVAKILIKDEKGEIVGIREATEQDGSKIVVHTKTANDLGWDAVDNKKYGNGPEEYIIEEKRYDSLSKAYAEGKAEAIECWKQIDSKNE